MKWSWRLALVMMAAVAGAAVMIAVIANLGSDNEASRSSTSSAASRSEVTTLPVTSTIPITSPPDDEHSRTLALTGMMVSANTVGPYLQATFPDSYAGIRATRADGLAYTVMVVGDPGPIQAAVAARFATPGLIGPFPEVTYTTDTYTLARLLEITGAIAKDEMTSPDGTGIVSVGPDPMGGGLIVDFVGPIDGVAERLTATYGVPVKVTQRDHVAIAGTG